MSSRYLTRSEAAEFIRALGLPITKLTLTKLASQGDGPVYRMFGNKSVYTETDLCDWVEKRFKDGKSSAARTGFSRLHEQGAR